jgi:hypothetical protein
MVGNVLLISKDFDVHAPSNYVKDLCFFMSGKGIDTHIVCYGEGAVDYDLGEKIHVHQVGFVLGANNPFNWHMLMNNELKKRCRELMETTAFDIIHCIDWTAYPAAIGVSRMFDKPYVITLSSTEKERGFSINESGMIADMEWLSTYDASHIITLSKTTYDILVYDYKIPEEKISLVNWEGRNPFVETESVYEMLSGSKQGSA